ncbi:winged helix-turn-helix domain-containing protein [Streptomyces sp. NPDC001220]
MTTREFDLLLALAHRAGQVLCRAQLLAQVWGYTWDVDTNVVDVSTGYLRKRLKTDGRPRVLQTVRGIRFVLRTGS